MGVKRTWPGGVKIDANDPFRHFRVSHLLWCTMGTKMGGMIPLADCDREKPKQKTGAERLPSLSPS